MGQYDNIDFADLLALSDEEVVTRSYVRDIHLESGRVLALVTLDNDLVHTRPNTLGPRTMMQLDTVLVELADRASRGEIQAVGVTGKPYFLAAGADLSRVADIPSKAFARKLAELGHRSLGRLRELGVPSFVFINGLALGGGLEIALNADYRTIDSSAAAIALPEVFLGLVPGWGGAYLLPNLIGIENALTVMLSNPLKNNRMLSAAQARDLGIADAMFGPGRFLEDSFAWADRVLGGLKVKRPHEPGVLERTVKWDIAVNIARSTVEKRIGTVATAPQAALRLLSAAKSGTRNEGFLREDEELADLISGDQFQASIYAFNLVQKRAKKPAGEPDPLLATKITKVGVIGAGLMARQFALLFARRLRVPVVLTDIDQSRLDQAIDYIHGEIDGLLAKGRVGSDDAGRVHALVSGTTDPTAFADADWVIEAVFEELAVKQEVFARFEKIIPETAVLATNTSSLSVSEIGANLAHPERLVGFHFFNPVAVMPLIEVVKAAKTNDTTLSTAMAVAQQLKKTAVITADSPGFVVNRLLAKLLGEAMHAVDTGTQFEVVENALDSFGMPMGPFEILDLVGLKVGAHVLDTHHAAFPERFFRSDNLHALAEAGVLLTRDKKGNITGFDPQAKAIVAGGTSPLTSDELRLRVEDGLAQEISLMLEDSVVGHPEDIDLCMILGAGWPFQMGGITPFLDRVGASERINKKLFHDPPVRGVS